MDKLARSDWKRHSAPYEKALDFRERRTAVSEVFDQAMEAFTEEVHEQRSATLYRDRKTGRCGPVKQGMASEEKTELSTDQYSPGVLKIFGETILPGVQYKSVLASCRSTAQELVKQALERFGLPSVEYRKFVLCDVVGRYESDSSDTSDSVSDCVSGKWEKIHIRILSDRDKPLLLQKFWKPIDGYSRRYELHARARVIDKADDDDTSGLNKNARKILMSKLRPGAIPLFDANKQQKCHVNGVNAEYATFMRRDSSVQSDSDGETSSMKENKTASDCQSMCSGKHGAVVPLKQPFFMNIRGFDVHRDKLIYVIKSKKFNFGNASTRQQQNDDTPKFCLLAPDIEPIHCSFKVYRFKKSDSSDPVDERNNYFLELDPIADDICVNGHKVCGKTLIKSGDIICVGIYYVFLYKDCSKGFDVPLALPWLPVAELCRNSETETDSDNCELKLNLHNADEESKSNTDESMDASITERMSFAYPKEKEEELVKYICAIIQHQNTSHTYSLTAAFLFSMCIEHASRKFERRQLKHLFLRILFTIRENVADTAKSLSSCKFTSSLLDISSQHTERDQRLDRLLLWVSNCVQLLLFLKHTFQLPELPLSDRDTHAHTPEKSPRKEDNAKHALGQLVTGLEEIIMFCFQQTVYTLTKTIHPALQALLEGNPFNEGNSEQCSVEDITQMLETLAEVTHNVLLHEGITRQLFTYLFFFANTNVFNQLLMEESAVELYNWQAGVRIRANLSQLEEWATKNGLDDEFGQMFEPLLAASELLATSKHTLVKYQWQIMKTHYQPLTPRQLYHILTHYQLGNKTLPAAWAPSTGELEKVLEEELRPTSLSGHPPFALPDNCGLVDLIRTPEDSSFWNHLRRLRSLYGVAEEDSDSGFSISNTPRGSTIITKNGVADPFFDQEKNQEYKDESECQESSTDSAIASLLQTQKSRIPLKKCHTNPWSHNVAKPGTGVCNCGVADARSLPRSRSCSSSDPESDANGQMFRTIATDLMKEERNEIVDSDGKCNGSAFSEKTIHSNKTKTLPLKLRAKSNKQTGCKSENKDKQTNLRTCRSVSSGNVADCSARSKSKIPQAAGRNRSKSVERNPGSAKVGQVESYSMDNINKRSLCISHKPSYSFEEAIERGYESDTRTFRKADLMSGSRIDSINENASELKQNSHSPKRYSFPARGSANMNNSYSEEVFVDEDDIDHLYKRRHTDINSNTLPNPRSFIPCVTSLQNSRTSRPDSQRHVTVSFDSDSHSSIELAKDDLFVSESREHCCDNGSPGDMDAQEIFPYELFTEVSASTLAARKRHGSSINVAPSRDNSPQVPLTACDVTAEVLEPGDRSKLALAPCPLFTVYLQKGSGGLGLGLIDGLHTPLRLAGIYIRKILSNSPAAANGCLQVGDRILAVSGKSVIGADYQSTMDAIKEAGDTLTLLVARGNDSMARKISASQL